MPDATTTTAPVAAPAAAPATAPAVAPSPAPAAPAAAPAPGSPPAAAPAPLEVESSLVGDAELDPLKAVESKYQVIKPDGTLDERATLLKVSKGQRELARKMGSGDVAPKAASDYTAEIPEAFAAAFKSDDPTMAKFRDHALSLGLSQKQFAGVLSKYFEVAPMLVQGSMALDGKAAVAELRKDWKTDGEFAAGLAHAERALMQLGNDDPEVKAAVLNKPAMVRFMAKVGAMLGEDSPPSTTPIAKGNEAAEQLMAHPAYANPRHPEHKAITERVNRIFAQQPGASAPA